jgi:hypothetical protein
MNDCIQDGDLAQSAGLVTNCQQEHHRTVLAVRSEKAGDRIITESQAGHAKTLAVGGQIPDRKAAKTLMVDS